MVLEGDDGFGRRTRKLGISVSRRIGRPISELSGGCCSLRTALASLGVEVDGLYTEEDLAIRMGPSDISLTSSSCSLYVGGLCDCNGIDGTDRIRCLVCICMHLKNIYMICSVLSFSLKTKHINEQALSHPPPRTC